MGWNSANEIFDPVARKMQELGVEPAVKTEILTVLIREMQQGDWDTEDESLAEFKDDEAIVAAFRSNGIITECMEQFGDGQWCELEQGHAGDHAEEQPAEEE